MGFVAYINLVDGRIAVVHGERMRRGSFEGPAIGVVRTLVYSPITNSTLALGWSNKPAFEREDQDPFGEQLALDVVLAEEADRMRRKLGISDTVATYREDEGD